MNTHSWIFIVAGSFFVAGMLQGSTLTASAVPDLSLKVTVRQKHGSEVGKALHLLELSCGAGECALTTITLNQCATFASDTPSFYPKVERSSTRDGNLKVTNLGEVLLAEEMVSAPTGPARVMLRFGHLRKDKKTALLVPTSFSGGYLLNSSLSDKIYSVDYVPLEGQITVVQLDCPAALPGVVSNQ
jgi:hypothetical protein